jgi:hypothetical protein
MLVYTTGPAYTRYLIQLRSLCVWKILKGTSFLSFVLFWNRKSGISSSTFLNVPEFSGYLILTAASLSLFRVGLGQRDFALA